MSILVWDNDAQKSSNGILPGYIPGDTCTNVCSIPVQLYKRYVNKIWFDEVKIDNKEEMMTTMMGKITEYFY